MDVKDLEHTSGNGVKTVSFSFFTQEQLRGLSVKRVTKSVTFDRLGRPQKDGLYDPSLGPVDQLERCVTCHLGYDDCPGHYGHVELALPTFHPLLFNELYRLLRATCFSCKCLRMSKDQKAYFVRILKLLREGRIKDGNNELMSDLGIIDENLRPADFSSTPFADKDIPDSGSSSKFVNKTSIQQESWNKACAEIMASMPQKCAHCNNPSQSIKKDGYLRMYQNPLSRRHRSQVSKTPTKSASKKKPVDDEAEESTPKKGKKGGDKGKGKKKKSKASDMLSSDEDEGDDDESSSSSDDGDGDSSGDDDEDGGAPDVMEKMVVEREGDEVTSNLPVNIHPLNAQSMVQQLFARDRELMTLMYGTMTSSGALKADPCMFFLQTLPVPPNRFRPPIHLGEQQFEHPYNASVKAIMSDNEQLLAALDVNGGEGLDSESLLKCWKSMQNNINLMIDSSKGETKAGEDAGKGKKQELERKEGLMRMNMMGKRVNFACRSVISPDPFMDTDQVGIPEVFAKKLSFGENVNQFNIRRLRQAVLNGPDKWPGANYIVDERGRKIDLAKKPESFRIGIAKQLERVDDRGMTMKVGRHLNDGDWVLVNRQPTLHKCSLLSHRVRVNRGQRVIRFHYANCKSYNADFDGDEINVHFPQDHFGRSEAAELLHTDKSYIVPTDGSPIRGLIQDHIVAGVQICQLDRFFTEKEYHQLLFLSLAGLAAELQLPDNRFVTQAPAMIKPVRRWTGKQLISTLLDNVLHGLFPLNTQGGCKIKGAMYGSHVEEGELRVRGNYLCTGVLDKNHIGASANGLVHAIFEAHGARKAGLILTVFGRLFTNFQKFHRAFTCGIEDLIVTAEGDARRRANLETANRRSLTAAANCAELPYDDGCDGISSKELEKRRSAVHTALAHHLHEERGRKMLDAKTSTALAPVTSGAIDGVLPSGQRVSYPKNNFEMMTATGAKGSKVNFSQICCLLGQQQLEGQRVPLMASYKTLPAFQPFETNAMAGGFVAGRFLTGIKPQEYFFHCMAGREGLVDTAVKTSRSGYLQRCLIKHLESLTVAYDGSVRDCDGAIVQFLYGEDGIDPLKQLGLKWLDHLADNSKAITGQPMLSKALAAMDRKSAKKHVKQVKKEAEELGIDYKEARKRHPPLASLQRADTHMGYVSETFEDFVDGYIDKNLGKPEALGLLRTNAGSSFRELAYYKYARSLAQPGEAVGAIAAQSVGEPSTQMTLNTFHSAGQGNATAGIPRLRELIMTASKKPATPTMTLCLKKPPPPKMSKKRDSEPPKAPSGGKQSAEDLAQQLSRIVVGEFVQGVRVRDSIERQKDGTGYERRYEVVVPLEETNMLPSSLRCASAARKALPACLEGRFTLQILMALDREIMRDSKSRGIDISAGVGERGRMLGEGDSDEEDGGGGRGKGKKGRAGEEAGGGDSDEDGDDDDDGGEEGGAKRDAKKMSKEYGEAAKDDRRAVKKSSQAAPSGPVDEEEEEEREGGGGITIVKMSAREKARLKEVYCVKYKATSSFTRKDASSPGELTICCSVPSASRRIMLVQLVEEVANRCVVQELSNINKCHAVENKAKEWEVVTEGCNLDLDSLWMLNQQPHINGALDLDRIRSNDVCQVLRVYGVEAARSALLDEISGVFGAYGIGVDRRHLSLICDAMTAGGEYRPLSRIGINNSASPLLKMSFETTCKFLTDATLTGDTDMMTSPSARLILGRPINTGTGAFDLRLNMAAAK